MKNRLFKSVLALLAITATAFAFVGEAQGANTVDTVANIQMISGDEVAPTLGMAAVAKKELVERELIKHFRHFGTWLEQIPSKNQWVNNDTIRLNEMGADPAVLINNNTYPIPVNSRTDSSTAISLYKYDTENTKISDDELYGLPYDKVGSVQQQHRETLEETTRMHALHSLAPAGNTTDTPIIETTGEDDGSGRRRLVYADLVNLKNKLDKLKVPKMGRVLVLQPDHIQDLLLEDKVLQNQYQNHKEGAITNKYAGFELYEDVYAPEYDGTLNKLAYDSVTDGNQASIVFHKKTTAKARGSVSVYRDLAQNNPTMRETVMGLRLWFLAIPTRTLGQAAIVNGSAA